MPIKDLRKNNTMAHILDALDDGKDIGHYGRLTFVMVAQYFADEEEIVTQLKKDKASDKVLGFFATPTRTNQLESLAKIDKISGRVLGFFATASRTP